MSFIRKIAGDTAIYGISSVLFKVVNFLFMTMYLTRKFPDAAEYAIHGLFYAFAAFIFVIYTLRMETAFFRFGNQAENKDRAFSTASVVLFITALVISVGLLLFAEPIAGLIKSRSDTRYIIWLALIMGFDTLVALPFAKMRLDNKALKFAVYKALNTMLGILFALVFLEILPWLDKIGVVQMGTFLNRSFFIDWVFIANIIASGVMVLLLAKEYFQVKFQFDKELLKKMWTYAWPLILVGLAGAFNQVSDRVFLNNLSSATDSGIYNGAIKIAVIMSLFVSAFNYAAEPFFFNQMHHQDAKIIYAKVAQAFSLTASLLLLGILLYLDLVEYLIGRNYREGVIILPYALLGYLFLGLHYNFSIWYKVKDKTYIGAVIGISGMVVTIIGNVVLIPRFGILGSAIALTCCFGVMATLSWLTGKRNHPIPYDLKRILGYILGALAFYGLSIWIQTFLPDSIGVKLMANTGIILLALSLLWWIDRGNLKALLRF